MSGKAYTMQEMRGIVEYITERKAFNEIKGRKMWMDFASSKMTTRTWQSLKETFLKRILPDIHNPYYKLTLHQIASFREGFDVEERLKNKLEIREANENGNKKDDKHVSESKPTEEEDKGEDHHISKVDRDSTETLVLNNCYESAEEIKRDLTSPIEPNKDIPTKKIRDMLEFEPMTPAAADVQKLIDDFGTDDEGSDGEPKMEIDLGENDKNCASMNDVPITISDSDSPTTAPNNKIDSTLQKSPSKNENTQMTKDTTSVTSEKREAENNVIDISNKETTKTDVSMETNEVLFNNSETIASTHSTLPDSILPNNQEELNKDSELNIDRKLNKPKTLSLNKNSVDSKVNKSLKKRINRISSTTSEENKHEAKKSKTKSAEEKETDTKQTVVDISVNNEVIDEENENNQEDILNEKENISQVSENQCLKSVSLYDVQLSKNNNSEAESSGDDLKYKNQKEEPNVSKNFSNNIVILKSHSESGTTNSERCDRRDQVRPAITKRYRDKALSNVFGFTSGAVRHRKSSYRKPSISHQQIYDLSSDSSEWTSDTASEFVSPPRGRRNKQTRKYLKPKSARITSLEKNGGLFVVYNNKIYPLVKDSKIVKNHVNYISDDESDGASERWKMKYLEEKKKSAELQRLLNMVQEQKQIEASRVPEAKCLAQCSSLKNNRNVCVNSDGNNKELPKQEGVQDEKPVKIKFMKNNEEVQLEGPLSHIAPALAQVMQLLNKVPQQSSTEVEHNQSPTKAEHLQGPTKAGHLQGPAEMRPSNMATNKEDSRPSSSLIAVSLYDEVQEKIDKLENEIFKEIEEKDKIGNTEPDGQSNVTKRSALRRKASATSTNVTPSSPKKRRGQQKDAHMENAQNESAQKENSNKKKAQKENAQESHQETAGAEVEPARRTRRTTRTSRNTDNEVDKNENNIITRRSLTKKTANKVKVQGTPEDDSGIKYKFPSPIPEKYTNKTKKSQKNLNSTRNQTLVSPCNLSYSSESMQGYQDSDISPAAICIKKRRTSFSSAQRSRTHNRYSRTKSISIPKLALDYESSNSFQNPFQTLTFQNSSLSTEVYRSDSYQLLMPINVKTVRDAAMIPIMENKENYNTDSKFPIEKKEDNITSNTDIQEHDGLSSSNVSLPTSPVLSIVENLSISRSLLTSLDDIPVDENHKLETFVTDQITLNNLMKSDPDVPMPLMEQECKIDADHNDGINYHYNINIHNTLTPNSQFLVNKLGTVNIEDQTLSESVNAKLKNLILDSNKKSKSKVNKAKNIESNDKDKLIQKGKTKKRSSTPRRRQTARIKRNSEPSIEEEHMETCSIIRKSCPPVIQTNDLELTGNGNTDKMEAKIKTPKEKKKKDIIKVKIIKPKDKANTRNKRKSNESLKQTVSNANSELHEADNSIDLIHNHSETCLQAHECIADSVEIIKNSHSIISVDSERSCNVRLLNVDEKLAQELYSSDARDGTSGYEEQSILFPMAADCTTAYHTALAPLSSANSLLTEDLSIEIPEPESKDKMPPRCTKWYLFSEDSNTNTNNVDINQNLTKDIGYGSNLNDLFPITCAVPDLSTITEMSKENDVDTRSNLESPIHMI